MEQLTEDDRRKQGLGFFFFRRTTGKHGLLERGKGLWVYGTRHQGHLCSKHRVCGLGLIGRGGLAARWVTWP